MREHHYRAQLSWNGQGDAGTTSYESYSRDFGLQIEGKPEVYGSADPVFRGDPTRHNPEDLLLGAIAGCHMLAYLALCARQGIVVLEYEDDAIGTLSLDGRGGGRFSGVTLRPVVIVADAVQVAAAQALHIDAHERCFIASSVAFPVVVDATVTAAAIVARHAGELST